MKKIALIETIPNSLKAAKAFLTECNADVVVLGSVGEAIMLREAPDLIVLQANRDPGRFRQDVEVLRKGASISEVKRISVLPAGLAGPLYADGVVPGEVELSMPLQKLEFLAVVARSLGVPPRRAFSILVTVQPEGSNIIYSGMSADFSENGMGFVCTEWFRKEQALIISFVNPKNRTRFQLRAEVVRMVSKGDGRTIFYGVRFIGASMQEREDLVRFITGSE